MQHSRNRARVAAFALAALLAGPQPVMAAPSDADGRLTGRELRAIASEGRLWCQDWSDETGDCAALWLLTPEDGDRFMAVTELLSNADPEIETLIGQSLSIKGDRLCSTFRGKELAIGFRVNGQDIDAGAGRDLRESFLAGFADLEGREVCQSFSRRAADGRLIEEVTVDGSRRPDLEAVYTLGRPGESFAVRTTRDETVSTDL